MLKGKEFGAAIAIAIKRKIDAGVANSKAEIARHFGIKPPSLVDWVKKGSVAKDKLPELWRFFSDVAGPEHWGLSDDEWPAGLKNSNRPIKIVRSKPREVAQDDKEDALLRGYRDASDELREILLIQARLATEKKQLFSERNETK